ncbi:Two-component sensor histidine kinase, contains HisKA and HATPase domains [Nocardioides scoriae]|uniref:histidine kinase n=1 Tax=Nocardioides scoriae TaxID=642780 RepID=A0A1H1XW42_9ACTN|nr:PAS domain-containing sensor histidine kinase [Nocardioides scoriae]SDT13099.1 Two-component sensor histidine kinase, contains HisKA and HATPase domains [Nocardioides scoriae]
MPSLQVLAREHTSLSDADVEWLSLLVADWQIIADLSFADLVLWLPAADGSGFWAGAQMRPTTGPTAYVDDVVGSFLAAGRRPLVDAALRDGRIAREGDPEWRDDVPVRTEAIPVRRGERLIAVVGRHTNLQGVRTPSRLELSYLQTASELSQMIARGGFPFPGDRSDHADTPRVGDGFIRVDVAGAVTYASPNALSVYRRLGLTGDLAGKSLAGVTRELVPPAMRPDEESISAVLGGRRPRDTELGNGQATVIARSIPLRPEGEPTGALVLLRDVTELRRRDRELVTKDATIREIHHRVKNNLQTVAALLRLQARRIRVPEGRVALEEAVRRVGAIAVVHETLSQGFDESVDFDDVADRLTRLVTDVGSAGAAISTRRTGSFGPIGSEAATPLAMVFTELLQNAVEHAFGGGASPGPGPSAAGRVEVACRREGAALRLVVEDDGVGLPEGFALESSASLGLSIVATLVGELGGTIELGSRVDGPGTRVVVDVPSVEPVAVR